MNGNPKLVVMCIILIFVIVSLGLFILTKLNFTDICVVTGMIVFVWLSVYGIYVFNFTDYKPRDYQDTIRTYGPIIRDE